MAQNYTRQSTFSDGDTITASLFNDEYNQLVNAFTYSSTSASSTGHRHDGSSGQGGNIFKIGDLDFLNKIEVDSTNNRWGFYVEVSSAAVEQIRIQDGAIVPVTDSDIDLGTTSLRFKDTYTDTITTTGNVDVGGNLTVTGTTTFNGGTITMGDAATDNVVFGADVDSHIIPDDDDTYDLGSTTQQWRNLYIDGTANIDSLVADTADINGGTIDGVTIGGSSAGAITGTTITGTSFVTSGNLSFADNAKAIFGAGGDLEIYHDTSNSIIRDRGIGDIHLRGNSVRISNSPDTVLFALFNNTDGAVSLYHANSEKLKTTSTGINVTGGIAATDDSTFSATSGNIYVTTSTIGSGRSGFRVDETSTNGFEMVHDNSDNAFFISRRSGNATVKDALKIDRSTGDFSLFEDTGTTAKLFWDASTERLGLGTSSPVGKLDITDSITSSYGFVSQEGSLVIKRQEAYGTQGHNLVLQRAANSDGTAPSILFAHQYGGPNSGEIRANQLIGRLFFDGWSPAASDYVRGAEITVKAISSVWTSTSSPADILFSTTASGATSPSERMRITSEGLLGLGTNSPSATLDVDGTIKLDGNYPTGTGNVALGNQALDSVASGGNYNVAIGSATLTGITTGGYNVGIGGLVAPNATTANYNVGIGMQALDALTTGYSNIAIGNSALSDITTQNNNVAIGPSALQSLTADTSTAVGSNALRYTTTGNGEAFGYRSQEQNTTGTNNVSFGKDSLRNNTTGSYSTAVGHGSLYNSTTSSQNTAVGYIALYNNTTGIRNTAVGYGAADANTTASNITAVGWQAAGQATVTTTAVGAYSLNSLTTGVNTTAVGYYSMPLTTTGSNNTAFGSATLQANTTGSQNVALGSSALYSATTASDNTAVGYNTMRLTTGSSNTAVGSQALDTNTTGANNVALGTLALTASTTAGYNTALGALTLRANTTGQYNVAVGYNSLNDNTTASHNVAVGAGTIEKVTTGGFNAALGNYSLFSNTTSAYNVAIGYAAAYSQTTGSQNVAIGKDASRLNETGTSNTAVGYQALEANTVSGNTAVGHNALTANTTGAYNTAVGYAALDSNQTGTRNDAFGVEALYSNTGSYNSAFGSMALYNNTTGSENVAIGYQTLYNNTTGEDNTGLGQATLYANTTGSYNTAAGRLALSSNTTGGDNAAIGRQALQSSTTGSQNTALGTNAGRYTTTGGSNVYIGYDAGQGGTTAQNNVAIGRGAMRSNQLAERNVAIGLNALYNLAPTTVNHMYQVAVGYNAGGNITTGTNNTVVGGLALDALTTGNGNVAIGYQALTAATTSHNNTAVGQNALRFTTTGTENVALGRTSLESNTVGSRATAIGYEALKNQNPASALNTYNVGFGFFAGRNITTGANNTAIGSLAGDAITTGTNNTTVGYNAGGSLTTGDNSTFVGQQSGTLITTGYGNTIIGRYDGNSGGLDIRTSNNYIVLSDGSGNPRVVVDSSGNTGIGTVSPTEKLHIANVTGNTGLKLDSQGTSTGITSIEFHNGGTGNPTGIIEVGGTSSSSNGIIFKHGNNGSEAERMRVDASGNLLVGTTSLTLTTAGIKLDADGDIAANRDGDAAAFFGRLSSDGEIVRFRKDGSTVGSIGTGGGSLDVYSSGSTKVGLRLSQAVIPMLNGSTSPDTVDLGTTTRAFKDLYLSGGAYLGGTAAANKLDDYEEGTFTSTITPATSGTITLNSSFDLVSYTKVGQLVHVAGALKVTSVSSPVGNYIQINVPFTIAGLGELSSRGSASVTFVDVSGSTYTASAVTFNASQSYVKVFMDASTIQANDEFYLGITYPAA